MSNTTGPSIPSLTPSTPAARAPPVLFDGSPAVPFAAADRAPVLPVGPSYLQAYLPRGPRDPPNGQEPTTDGQAWPGATIKLQDTFDRLKKSPNQAFQYDIRFIEQAFNRLAIVLAESAWKANDNNEYSSLLHPIFTQEVVPVVREWHATKEVARIDPAVAAQIYFDKNFLNTAPSAGPIDVKTARDELERRALLGRLGVRTGRGGGRGRGSKRGRGAPRATTEMESA